MFTFSRHRPATTVVIDGSELLLGDTLTVDHMWPAGDSSTAQLHHVAAQAINTPADAIDQALTTMTTSANHHKPLREFAFTHQHGISGSLWHTGADYSLAIKGLPENVFAHCDMTDNEREAAELHLQKLSLDGAIIIAVAHATLSQPISSLSELNHKHRLTLSGLISLTSTIPGEMRELIRQARKHDTSLRLMTGTHRQTAFAIAEQFGIATHPNEVTDARQLHVAPSVTQATTVFARALPEHKAQIIKALREMNTHVTVVATKEELIAALTAKPRARRG